MHRMEDAAVNVLPALVPRADASPRPAASRPLSEAVRVQPVLRADAALLMSLCDAQRAECLEDRQAVFGSGTGGVLELMEALFETPLRAWAWIAHDGDLAIGHAATTAGFSPLERGYYLRLEALYVDAGWRGRGVERQLLHAAREAALRMGCVNLQWQDGAHLPRLPLDPAAHRHGGGWVLPLPATASA